MTNLVIGIKITANYRPRLWPYSFIATFAQTPPPMAKRRKRGSNPIVETWHKLPPYLRNRYFLTLVAFAIIMFSFSNKDLITQFQLRRTVTRLEAKQLELAEKIKKAEAERLDMELEKERFARETYFMQRDNEDVFIFVPEERE